MPLQIDRLSYRSPNHSARPTGTSIDMLIFHDGEGPKASDIHELTRDDVPIEDRVSAHYYVDRQGRVYELVDPQREAWHAGVSSWEGRHSLEIRNHSIGIESEHIAGQNWPDVQRRAYHDLCLDLIGRFPIQQKYVAAHRWIAPGRKFDPTDWPDSELRPFIAALFTTPPDPLRVAAVPSPPNTPVRRCSQILHDFYIAAGGISRLGYALMDEARAIGMDGRVCSYLVCERVVLKSAAEGPHLALLVEARAQGWLL